MRCPMCNVTLLDQRICPQCGREWLSETINGEEVITSKPRIVELIDIPEEGKILDDCIRPIPIHTFTYSVRGRIGVEDSDETFTTQEMFHRLCPPLKNVKGKAFRSLHALKIVLDDFTVITIKRDDFEGAL